MKRREVHVVSCAFPDFPKQRAIHPVHDGAVQFSGAMKSQAIFIEIGDENVLHLQEATRMKEWKRVMKTFERARAQVKANIAGSLRQYILQLRSAQVTGNGNAGQIVQASEALFEAHRSPDFLPQSHAAPAIGEVIGTAFEQSVHGTRDVSSGNFQLLADALRVRL